MHMQIRKKQIQPMSNQEMQNYRAGQIKYV